MNTAGLENGDPGLGSRICRLLKALAFTSNVANDRRLSVQEVVTQIDLAEENELLSEPLLVSRVDLCPANPPGREVMLQKHGPVGSRGVVFKKRLSV